MMRTLHWRHPGRSEFTPHEMRVAQQPLGCKVILLLEKPGGSQVLEAYFEHVTQAAFVVAWNSQNDGCWLGIDDVEQTPSAEPDADDAAKMHLFFAIRYIALPNNAYIVWRTDHRDNAPNDSLGYFQGTLREMRDFYARMTYTPPKSEQE